MEITTQEASTMTAQTTDSCGFTDRQWEKMWSDRSQNDGCQTAHSSQFDDESYCDNCESEVVYSGPNDPHGKCKCDH